MPKEQINYPRTKKVHQSCFAPAGDGEEGPCICTPLAETWPTVAVRWGDVNDGNVQLVLMVHEQPAWDDWVATKPWDGPSAYPAPPVVDERHSAVLSRKDVNKLIQVLRRARDQAYGRDE